MYLPTLLRESLEESCSGRGHLLPDKEPWKFLSLLPARKAHKVLVTLKSLYAPLLTLIRLGGQQGTAAGITIEACRKGFEGYK
jgi:hypothetical protein